MLLSHEMPSIIGSVTLIFVGRQIARQRKSLKLSQAALSRKAGVSRATLDALKKMDVPTRWVFQSSQNCWPRSDWN